MRNNFKIDQLVSDISIALIKKEQAQVIVKGPKITGKKPLACTATEPLHIRKKVVIN